MGFVRSVDASELAVVEPGNRRHGREDGGGRDCYEKIKEIRGEKGPVPMQEPTTHCKESTLLATPHFKQLLTGRSNGSARTGLAVDFSDRNSLKK